MVVRIESKCCIQSSVVQSTNQVEIFDSVQISLEYMYIILKLKKLLLLSKLRFPSTISICFQILINFYYQPLHSSQTIIKSFTFSAYSIFQTVCIEIIHSFSICSFNDTHFYTFPASSIVNFFIHKSVTNG